MATLKAPPHPFQMRNPENDKANMLSRRYEQLLRAEKYCDVVFHVANASVKCHKLILSAASPVFEAMFYGPMHEIAQDIEILDISPEIFNTLVDFIYAGSVNFEQLSLEETIELYYCAEKYLLDELIHDCLLTLTRKLRFSNILPALELSVCMDFKGLLDVCMSFFTRCCLCDPQFKVYLKCHYLHVSKDCIKTIIAMNRDLHQQLLWFVYEWCQQQCIELGLKQSERALIIDDLQLPVLDMADSELLPTKSHLSPCRSIERSYYKACRPFTVDGETSEWQLMVRSDRFISLLGIVMHSRLTPNMAMLSSTSEYNESFSIEISACNQEPVHHSDSSDGEESDHNMDQEQEVIIWRHSVNKQPTKYNCDFNISWEEGVILSPDVQYKLKLSWPTDAYGAEYPCSLFSNTTDGIQFRDYNAHYGSLVKGLRFVNLV